MYVILLGKQVYRHVLQRKQGDWRITGRSPKKTSKKVSSLKLSEAPEICMEARPIIRGLCCCSFQGGEGCTTWQVWNPIQKSKPILTNISTAAPDFWTINRFQPRKMWDAFVASSNSNYSGAVRVSPTRIVWCVGDIRFPDVDGGWWFCLLLVWWWKVQFWTPVNSIS